MTMDISEDVARRFVSKRCSAKWDDISETSKAALIADIIDIIEAVDHVRSIVHGWAEEMNDV